MASDGKRACCGRCGCSKATPVVASNEDAPQLEFVLSILARKCQGQAEIWLALGAVAPPPDRLQLTREQNVCGRLDSPPIALDSLTLDLATPPPRV
jgi:hypothetical protein